MKKLLSALVLGLAACGGVAVQNDFDASGNPVPDAGPVLEPDGGVPGVSRNGWTWSNVGPQAADLYGVWGSASNDVWFVGAAGVILHFDGSSFSAPDSKTNAELRGVWGSGKNDVWAVGRSWDVEGNATIVHFDGSAWSIAASVPGELYAVWGTSSSDVWAVGGKGLALHFDGNTWTQVPTTTQNDLDGVFASGPNDAWAVGSVTPVEGPGTILRWNGTSWISVPSPKSEATFAHVWGTSGSDVWLAGQAQIDKTQPMEDPNGYAIHWNGKGFDDELVVSSVSTPLRAVFGSSGQLDAVGSAGAVEAWNGSWSSHTLPGDFEATWQSAPNDVWAVGLGGVMAHFDGTSWTELEPPPPAWGEYQGAALWSNGPNDAWVAGNGALGAEIQHWDGHAWSSSTISAASPAYLYFYALWGTSASNMWGVGSGPGPKSARIVHFDGSAWSVAFDLPGNYAFLGVWGASENDVWFSGDDGALAHFDGTKITYTPISTQDQLFAVRGSGATDVWLAGNTNLQLTMRHFDGSSWSVAYSGDGEVTSLYVASPSDAWGVGWEGSAVHWNGSTWTDEKLPSDVGAIWGSSASDIWAVGYFGAVLHYDGASWSSVPVTESSLAAVGGSSALDVWMLTSAGAILHHP